MTLPITKKAKGSMTKLEQCTRIISNGYYDGKPSADVARAVLTELLTPDEGMVEAGRSRLPDNLIGPGIFASGVWHAMINHILTEGEG